MSECPICGSDEYNSLRRVCDECGEYDESLHHGTLAAERREQERRVEREQDRRRSGWL